MKLLFKAVFAAYLLMLLWLVLFKFSLDIGWVLDAHDRSLNLIPFADLAESLRGMIDNFLIFIPFGLLLGVNLKDASWRRKLAYIALFSSAVEVIQFVCAIGVSDITDILMNTAGGLLGVLLYSLGRKRIDDKKLDIGIAAVVSVAIIAVCGILFSQRVRVQMRNPVEAAASSSSSKTILSRNVQLTWPVAGQAAVGSVEDGVLARSSVNEETHPTASMAKVIMALAVMKKHPFAFGTSGSSYTITAKDVATYQADAAMDGSVVPVYEGMVLTQYQAMQAMLIPSANNMADMLAEKIFGSKQAYVTYAQDMVRQMGLDQTVIADASGYSPLTRSTPSELVMIGIAALKNPVIADIVAQPQATIPGVGLVKNTNELLGDEGVVGIKTGTTSSAGSCLLFAARYETGDGQKVTIVAVVMGDTDAAQLFADSRQLLASAQQAFGLSSIQLGGQ